MSLVPAWQRVIFISGVLWAAIALVTGMGLADQVETGTNIAAGIPEVQEEKAPVSEAFTPLTIGEYFSCRIPAGWWKDDYSFELSAVEKKVFGVTVQAPEPAIVPIKISMHYYAAGNLLYRSIEQFVTLHSQPILGPSEDNHYGPVTEATVSGRKARTFERQKKEFVAIPNLDEPIADDDPRVYERRERMATPVSVTERFIAVPAKSGFYALRYSAPTEDFPRFLGVFDQVTASFEALK